ncbi:MAG: sulfatase-like hydrolase/transferase [Armatimonadaceae bacterium]
MRTSTTSSPQNVLILISDQLAQRAVGAYGDPYRVTPTIDSLADRGVRFANAYCNTPLCGPSRASFWSGRYPHETGVLSNGRNFVNRMLPEDWQTVGTVFRAAGYETAHFGKRHDSGGLRRFDLVEPEGELPVEGTEALPVNYDTRRDRYTTEKVIEWLEQEHEKPFLLVADLQNPHDICSWIGANQGPHEDIPIPGFLPDLPPNFEDADFLDRPMPVQYICCSHNRMAQAAAWNENNYRHYLAAYYHYIQRVDLEISRILTALAKAGLEEDTLIVFFADHGEGMGSHRMVTKQVSFYEETNRIPWIFAGPGVRVAPGTLIEKPLVSLLDLLPTLADMAGLPVPEGLHGRSLAPFLRGEREDRCEPGEYVAGEWHTEWGFTIEPGRMIRTARYKYTRYIEGDGEELFDLQEDPWETRTLIHDPAHQATLKEHRQLLAQHLQATDDPFFSLEPLVAPRWRSHKPGNRHHQGPAAPSA